MSLHFLLVQIRPLVSMSLERLIPFLAKSIRRRREQLCLSHAEVASLTGLSPEYLEFIEKGSTMMSMKTLTTVADALRYAPSELIEQAEKLAESDGESDQT